MTVTFDEQSNGQAASTMRHLQPTKAQRGATIGFRGVEFGFQTLDKLAAYMESLRRDAA